MKKVIITGAGGFIGMRLCQYLSERGIEVYAIDFSNRQHCFRGISHLHFIPLGENGFDDLLPQVEYLNVDTLYHLAWNGVSSDLKNDIFIHTRNISTCVSALIFAEQIGCKHVIIPGSASEYAYCGEVINGSNIPAPSDIYAASKAASHILCQAYALQHMLSLNWLLISSVYGPGRNDNNLISYCIKSLLERKKPSLTQLEQKWDYIYIDDLLSALYLVGQYGKEGKVYPVGFGEAFSLRHYVEIIHNAIDINLPIGIGEQPYKNGKTPDNSIIDITELTNDTGFLPQVSFQDGIEQTIEYFKKMVLIK